MKYIENPFEDGRCFFCGPDNPDGLRLRFYRDDRFDDERVSCQYTPEQRFQGQGSVLHGGMQMGLLDEAMWWAGYARTDIKHAVTVSAKFRFLRPVYIGKPHTISCVARDFKDNTIDLMGWILDENGKMCTTVTGAYRVVSEEMYDKVVSGKR